MDRNPVRGAFISAVFGVHTSQLELVKRLRLNRLPFNQGRDEVLAYH